MAHLKKKLDQLNKFLSTKFLFFFVSKESYDFGIDHGPFLHVSVKEFLWGYPSVLASMGRVQALGCGGVQTVTSGLYYKLIETGLLVPSDCRSAKNLELLGSIPSIVLGGRS